MKPKLVVQPLIDLPSTVHEQLTQYFPVQKNLSLVFVDDADFIDYTLLLHQASFQTVFDSIQYLTQSIQHMGAKNQLNIIQIPSGKLLIPFETSFYQQIHISVAVTAAQGEINQFDQLLDICAFYAAFQQYIAAHSVPQIVTLKVFLSVATFKLLRIFRDALPEAQIEMCRLPRSKKLHLLRQTSLPIDTQSQYSFVTKRNNFGKLAERLEKIGLTTANELQPNAIMAQQRGAALFCSLEKAYKNSSDFLVLEDLPDAIFALDAVKFSFLIENLVSFRRKWQQKVVFVVRNDWENKLVNQLSTRFSVTEYQQTPKISISKSRVEKNNIRETLRKSQIEIAKHANGLRQQYQSDEIELFQVPDAVVALLQQVIQSSGQLRLNYSSRFEVLAVHPLLKQMVHVAGQQRPPLGFFDFYNCRSRRFTCSYSRYDLVLIVLELLMLNFTVQIEINEVQIMRILKQFQAFVQEMQCYGRLVTVQPGYSIVCDNKINITYNFM